MKSSVGLWLLFILCFLGATSTSSAQVDSLIGQITSSSSNTFVRDISGDGRFVVFESDGDIATERTTARNNADGNTEIFLFDYAQRRIFQITNTKRVLVDSTRSSTEVTNIQVNILNVRPVIANQLVNNELWIAFNSNATTSTATAPQTAINPGNFNGLTLNQTERTNVIADGNTELFFYSVPITTPNINLSSGIEPPFNDLSAGTFTQVTNTAANQPSEPGRIVNNTIIPPFISDDNRDPSINNDASFVAFISNRNYTSENGSPDNNAEVFVYSRASNTYQQITQTPRATANAPIFSANPSISGNGARVVFYTNATTPRTGVTTVNNADNNGEVVLANLNANGSPASFVQVTNTTRTNPSDTIILFSPGRRISRDGRYVAFESLSDNPSSGGTNQPAYQLFVFDADNPTTNPPTSAYRAIGPRGDADPGAIGGDVRRFPVVTTVYDPVTNTSVPGVVFTSRLNFRPDATVPTTAGEGLNPDAARQVQIFSAPLSTGTPIRRISRFPVNALYEIQPYVSNTSQRIAFNIPAELGGGNSDNTTEGFYLLSPNAGAEAVNRRVSFATGASGLRVGTPSPTPTASPSPSPQTPSAVAGLAPNMVGVLDLTYGRLSVSQMATGTSTARRFPLPIELGGVSLSINNAAAGIYSINLTQGNLVFVVPAGLAAGTYPVVLNDNGRITRTTLTIVAAQPDIFRRDNVIAPGGRASVFNVTNRVNQAEPFSIRTRLEKGGGFAQTRVRIFLTGVQGAAANALSVRIGNVTIPAANILTGAIQTDRPGVYSIDILLPPELRNLGDVPIVVTATINGTAFVSRLDDTAPRVIILP